MTLSLHRKMLSATAAASVMLLTAACGSDGGDTASDTSSSSSEAPSEDAPTEAAEPGAYTDGEYEGEGSYANPGGTSSVSVALTLEGGTITDIEVTPEAQGTSGQFQNEFASGIADEVVGVSIDEIEVSKVSGSSLTSEGFNQAIDQIKADAAA